MGTSLRITEYDEDGTKLIKFSIKLMNSSDPYNIIISSAKLATDRGQLIN